MRGVLRGLLVLAGLLLAGQAPALAAGGQVAGGLSISPIYQNVSIGQNQPNTTYYVVLSNHSAQSQEFNLSTVDFGSLNQSGGIAFLGTSSSGYAQKYGLVKWMHLSEPAVTIPGDASVQIGVTIANDSSLGFGGHYGAVLATAQTAPGGTPARARVGVLEVLSSLLLLVKAGGPLPDLQIIAQTVGSHFGLLPTTVGDTFHDQGDAHVVPRGIINVTDPRGRLVERGVLNVNSGIVLPETARHYSTPLLKLADAWLPGYYRVSTIYRYDGTNATKIYVSGFWYVNLWIAWGAAALVVVLGAGAVWWLRFRRRPRG